MTEPQNVCRNHSRGIFLTDGSWRPISIQIMNGYEFNDANMFMS